MTVSQNVMDLKGVEESLGFIIEQYEDLGIGIFVFPSDDLEFLANKNKNDPAYGLVLSRDEEGQVPVNFQEFGMINKYMYMPKQEALEIIRGLVKTNMASLASYKWEPALHESECSIYDVT